MNQLIEDYFYSLLVAADLAGDPDIYPGTCADIREPNNSAILVIADSIENSIGTLHRANVKIIISSPAENRQTHRALAYEVKQTLEDSLPASAVFVVGGWVTKTHNTQVSDDGRWITSVEGLLGLNMVTP